MAVLLTLGLCVGPAFQPLAQTVLQPDNLQFEPDELDILEAIREHFRRTLPAMWWFNEPEGRFQGYQVVVHIPDAWGGNPTSAVMNFCPERASRIWEKADSLTILPYYRDLPWPGFECFKPSDW